jgi:hypothetical protein
MHFAVMVAAGTAAYLDASQKAEVETDLGPFWVSLNALMPSGVNIVDYVWHDWFEGDRFYGPADRITSSGGITGTIASSRLPDQVAATITFRTASRKHWGRMYVPSIAWTKMDSTYGRIANGTCDILASAARTLALATEANTARTSLVVFSLAHQAVLTIDEIHCDNVPDIVRRRRAKSASYRKAFTA